MSYQLIPFHRQFHPGLSLSREIIVCSVDPGLTNFAIRVERRAPGKVPEMLLFEKKSFGGKVATKAHEEDGTNVVRIWGEMLDYMDDITPILDQVTLYTPEKQLPFNHSVDTVSQHFKTSIMQRYRDRPPYPVMMEIDPHLKTALLKPFFPPKGQRKKDYLKEASVAAAEQILTARGDEESLQILRGSKKKDDLADNVVQVEALFKLLEAEGV